MEDLDWISAATIAKNLGKEAGQAILDRLHDPMMKAKKKDGSWITDADLQSNQYILKGLQKNFPDHAILTEESGLSGNPHSPYTWVVDPLDGTKAYAKGIPGFCVMIGLLKGEKPVLGVVVDPLEGHVYEAIKGQGAYHTYKGHRQRLSVSKRNDFSKMSLVISTGFPGDTLEKIRQILSGPLVAPINSVGIKVGLLVRQEGDLYINHHSVHYWDTCAPQVILEEAGGIFTRLDGKPLTYEIEKTFSHDSPTLATNNTRHSEITDILLPLF